MVFIARDYTTTAPEGQRESQRMQGNYLWLPI
jgi:hypothetical protein